MARSFLEFVGEPDVPETGPLHKGYDVDHLLITGVLFGADADRSIWSTRMQRPELCDQLFPADLVCFRELGSTARGVGRDQKEVECARRRDEDGRLVAGDDDLLDTGSGELDRECMLLTLEGRGHQEEDEQEEDHVHQGRNVDGRFSATTPFGRTKVQLTSPSLGGDADSEGDA